LWSPQCRQYIRACKDVYTVKHGHGGACRHAAASGRQAPHATLFARCTVLPRSVPSLPAWRNQSATYDDRRRQIPMPPFRTYHWFTIMLMLTLTSSPNPDPKSNPDPPFLNAQLRWRRDATTTQCWVWRRAPATRTSRRPTTSWPSSTTPTPTRYATLRVSVRVRADLQGARAHGGHAGDPCHPGGDSAGAKLAYHLLTATHYGTDVPLDLKCLCRL